MAIKKRPLSPRQKMINLMYVVLMAMLALNISNEVLNGFTIVEDESTCAVFGMPAAAIEVGGASVVRPRGEISQIILHSLEG